MKTDRKRHLKRWISSVSNFIDLTQFHLICQMLAKFSGVESERTVSKCVLCSPTPKRAQEIWTFHVAVVQRRQRNVQKRMMLVQSCCFANINLLLFPFSLPSLSSLLKGDFTRGDLQRRIFSATQLYNIVATSFWKAVTLFQHLSPVLR